jgi:hypothetical protein
MRECRTHANGKLRELEVDDDKRPEPAVKQYQVDPVPFDIDSQTALPTDEGKIAAQLQEEGLKSVNERFFEV